MSSGLMNTEVGGEQTQYEAAATEIQPHKKSAGQLGQSSSDANTTTDASKTSERQEANAERGQQKAENMRYGQTISEGGMGGMTTTDVAGGKAQDRGEDGGEAGHSRRAEGYGGSEDVSREVGG